MLAATRLSGIGAFLAGALVLAGCGAAPQAGDGVASEDVSPSKPPITTRFDCDTLAVMTTFHEDRVVIDMPGRSVTLPQVVAASGARYSDGKVTFWNKGREATFDLDGRSQTCRERRDPWQDAADRGVDFRAVGQEPGWFLEIDNGNQSRFVYDYAEHELVAALPWPARKGTSTIYDTMIDSHHLLVLIEDAACTDAMSGEPFPRTVTVTIGARTLHGCGRELSGGTP